MDAKAIKGLMEGNPFPQFDFTAQEVSDAWEVFTALEEVLNSTADIFPDHVMKHPMVKDAMLIITFDKMNLTEDDLVDCSDEMVRFTREFAYNYLCDNRTSHPDDIG